SLPSTPGNLTPAQVKMIESFADKYEVTVDVVGSRAAGTATATSDFDYVIAANSRIRKFAKFKLPRGIAGGEIGPNGIERGIDVFNGNLTPTNTSLPYIRFLPRGKY